MMWNGTFAFQKSIGSVKLVPVTSMTARDWRWLDYDNTRNIAQNRIANLIMSGKLKGFFQVMITEKSAKNEYFWPADLELIEEFAVTEEPTFFLNRSEALTLNDAVMQLERLRNGMFNIPIWAVVAIIELIEEIASDENSEELSSIEQDFLEQLEADDMELLLSTLMMWEMSLEEAEKVLDDLPESDEADTIRDWINDKIEELGR